MIGDESSLIGDRWPILLCPPYNTAKKSLISGDVDLRLPTCFQKVTLVFPLIQKYYMGQSQNFSWDPFYDYKLNHDSWNVW